jgi:hypothetical protein
MKTELTGLPKLNCFRLNEVAAPVFGTWNILAVEPLLVLGDALK